MSVKPPAKKRTFRLKISDEIHYKLIGISCHENDYRLVWAINTQLKMNFIKTTNLVVHNPKLKTDLEFSRFAYTDEDRYITYNLISNRCPDGFLFPEIRNFDFILQLISELKTYEIEDLVKSLRKIGIISAVFPIRPEDLRNLNYLTF